MGTVEGRIDKGDSGKVRLMKITKLQLAIAFLAIVGWEGATRFRIVHPLLMSPLSAIILKIIEIVSLRSNIPNFPDHVMVTLTEIGAAYALVVTFGLFFGFILAEVKLMGDTFYPLILLFYAIPSVVIYPILYITLGIGQQSVIALAFILGLFPVLVNSMAGFRQVERPLINVGRSMGATRWALYTRIIFPAAAPAIVSGLRLGMASTVIGVVVAEMIASYAGLASLIDWASSMLLTTYLYALVVITISVAVGINLLFGALERRFRYGRA